MKKSFLQHVLLIAVFFASISSHRLEAMDDIPETYSTLTMSAAAGVFAITTFGITWFINHFCRNATSKPESEEWQTFAMWKTLCDKLPDKNHAFRNTSLCLRDLMRAVRAYIDLEMYSGQFIIPEKWLGAIPNDRALFEDEFTPYAQKLIVPSDAEVAFHGDLHGDIHALNAFIQDLNTREKMDGFKIIEDKFYMLFLGDYTDRGYYGAEVWYTILRLKLANPNRVYMVRGNHEDRELNERDGFFAEFQAKFGGRESNLSFQELQRLYNFLPVAIYLGASKDDETNYLLCCHGGLELGFNPIPLFEDTRTNVNALILDKQRMLSRSEGLEKLSTCVQESIRQHVPEAHLGKSRFKSPGMVTTLGRKRFANQIGFMWNDYILNTTDIVKFHNGRGWVFGKQLTQETLALHSTEKHKLRGVFRAHQHGDLEMMRRILNKDDAGCSEDQGVGKLWTDHEKIKEPHALWDGIVCTFLVAPSMFGKIKDCPFDYDAFGILKMHPEFNDWRLNMIRVSNLKPINPAAASLLALKNTIPSSHRIEVSSSTTASCSNAELPNLFS